jgi:hypothetical protein
MRRFLRKFQVLSPRAVIVLYAVGSFLSPLLLLYEMGYFTGELH